MDGIDIYMTMAAGSMTAAVCLWEETALAITPAAVCCFAVYCVVMAARSLGKEEKHNRRQQRRAHRRSA